MKLDVPVFNEDGSIRFTASLTPGETQVLLQFGLNMAVTAGLVTFIQLGDTTEMKMDFQIPEDATVQ